MEYFHTGEGRARHRDGHDPIASVIIPVHNRAPFVRTAIASALVQTCREIEIIVVDDGPTDDTWDVIGDCAKQDSRVLRLRRAVRAGPAAARNAALDHATGRWIALLDADDAFLPDRLAELITRAEGLNADFLADNLILRDFQTGAALGKAYSENGIRFFETLVLGDILMRDIGFIRSMVSGRAAGGASCTSALMPARMKSSLWN